MTVRRVAVIGAGTMGSGIAQVCAQTGWETVLYDAFTDSLDRGFSSINEFWMKGVSRGKTRKKTLNPGQRICFDRMI